MLCFSALCRHLDSYSPRSQSLHEGHHRLLVRHHRRRQAQWRSANTAPGYEGVYSATPPPQHGPNVLGGARGQAPPPVLPVDLPPQAFLTSAMLLDMVDSMETPCMELQRISC
jgi:U6 snRNA-associated Sm-like protein LSm1